MYTLILQITVWIFFFLTIAITAKAHKDNIEWRKWLFGIISVILALVGIIDLLVRLSPYLSGIHNFQNQS